MRILFASTSPGALQSGSNSYFGVGWMSSLQGLLEEEKGIELALAFPTGENLPSGKRYGKTHYFPLYRPGRSPLGKLAYYYGGYRKLLSEDNISNLLIPVIESFQPDLIHIFGTESDIPLVMMHTDVPCLIHLQGLLGACHQAFFPPDIDEKTFRKEFVNIRENVLRNGIRFNYREMGVRADREEEYLRRCRFFMGRTGWDKAYVLSRNPSATYFHVDEVLRPPFYEAGKWQAKERSLTIVSTISDVLYKGFGLILRTASILKDMVDDFTWTVIGVNPSDPTVRFFEKHYGISHTEVNVECAGVLPAERIIPLLQEAIVFVHPSYIDNSPNSLCEAQYLGVPAIATDVGGISTLMASQPWNLVPPGDPHALASRIMRITPEDNQMSDALGRHDKKVIRDGIVSAYEFILNH